MEQHPVSFLDPSCSLQAHIVESKLSSPLSFARAPHSLSLIEELPPHPTSCVRQVYVAFASCLADMRTPLHLLLTE